MSVEKLFLLFLMCLISGYAFYSKFLVRFFGLSDAHKTPAHRLNDGQDFVPTHPFYLFGQHFSAISAAGPIAGPIAACLLFGWLPCLLWIGVGAIFIGAVHDFSSLAASIRHEAGSIAEIAKKNLGHRAGLSVLIFIWIVIVYIMVAFADITAGSFVSATEELQGIAVSFNPGGAVACASILYLTLAILMGLVQKYLKPPLWLLTLIFVPATFAVAWLGTSFSHLLIWDVKTWGLLILIYCAIASLLPLWLLLQPRGYLGGFILYFALALGVIGIFFGGYDIEQPLFRTWDLGTPTGSLFPFLFVTIACGACSGFHGLVCSGTSSKQIDRESHVRSVGYGAMLAEGCVAFIALVIVMIATPQEVEGLKPGTIYGNGIGKFLTLLIGKEHLKFAITFGAMAFSTFVFDTLDVATRLGRYILQELMGQKNFKGAMLGTLLTVTVPALILMTAPEGSWLKFWILFGASNQLLAAVTLLIVTVWLWRLKKPILVTLLPMFFVLTMTIWALVKLAVANWQWTGGLNISWMNSIAALVLVILALGICGAGLRMGFKRK